MAISKEDVLSALKHVDDPDLKKDLVTLNMIEEVVVNGNKVSFTVRLTTPACPLKEKIKNDCVNAIHEHLGSDVDISGPEYYSLLGIRAGLCHTFLSSHEQLVCYK